MNTRNGEAGGGKILKYIFGGSSNKDLFPFMNFNEIRNFALLPYIRAIIILLIIAVAIMIISRVLNLRSPFKGKAIGNELKHIDAVKKYDAAVIRYNNILRIITNIVEKSPFSMSKSDVEYMDYNLERANVRVPGKFRVMKSIEFNAIIKTVQLLLIILLTFIAIFINAPLGLVGILSVIFIGNILPTMWVRAIVKEKDDEVKLNFASLYLMVHYILLNGSGTSLISTFKTFDKTTSSEEMHRVVDVCTYYMEVYGEYDGATYIAKAYREIPEMTKLMRLIRQANAGGDVRAELIGFKNEVISAKRYVMEVNGNKMIEKAKRSFMIVMPILAQAILSAMAIYLEDLKLAQQIF